MKSSLLLLAVLLASALTVFAADENMVTFGGGGGPNGKYFWGVAKSAMMATPKWSGPPERPPLSLDDAYKVAKDWYAKQGITGAELLSIELARSQKLENRWYYRLRFDANSHKTLTTTYELATLIILMDKTVVTFTPQAE